ncbi:MAG: 6-carboxytetrahydropterin synthase QueD [Dehalococcoidia bacterium]
MYRISVRQHFDAAHYLRNYGGKCEELHGHRFQVVVTVAAQELNDIGMAFDFTELKRHLQQIVDRFDHVCLNNIAPFDEINPSSENIARTVYNELRPRLDSGQASISSVEVWESPDSWVTYVP